MIDPYIATKQILDENRDLKYKLNKLKELTEEIEFFKKKERMLSLVQIGIWVYDFQKKTFIISEDVFKIVKREYNNKELSPEEFFSLVGVKDHQSFLKKIQAIAQENSENITFDEKMIIDNQNSILCFHGNFLKEELKVIGSIQDVTTLRKNQQGLENSNRKLNTLLQLIDQYVITYELDLEYNIISGSEAFKKLLHINDEQLLSINFLSLIKEQENLNITEKLFKQETWRGEFYNFNPQGEKIWIKAHIAPNYDKDLNITGYCVIGEDITNLKKLASMSIKDELTGLHNRRYYNQVITKELSRLKRSGENVIFIMIDIDHFKQYNDTYGHDAGDKVLHCISQIFLDNLKRGSDYSFRLGGEEFGILFSSVDEVNSLMFANKLREEIEDLKIPHINNSISEFVTASMGVVFINLKENPVNEKEIYIQADKALYKAKQLGRNRCHLVRLDAKEQTT